MRSRSPLSPVQQRVYASLVKIHPLLQEIECRQEAKRMPIPTGSAPKTVCPRPSSVRGHSKFIHITEIFSLCICLYFLKKWVKYNKKNTFLLFQTFSTFALNSFINEPRHDKTCLCHMRTTKAQISLRILASVAAQAGLSLPWSQTPKTGFLMTRLKCLLDWNCKKLLVSFTKRQSTHTLLSKYRGNSRLSNRL